MSESSVPASDDNLRPKKKKKGAASIICKWGGYKRSDLQLSPIFYKIYKETLPGKDGNKPVPPLKAKTQHWLQPAYWGMWGGDTSSWWLNRQLLEHSLVAIQITKRTNSGDWCGTVEKNGFKQLVKELNTRSHAENTCFNFTILCRLLKSYKVKLV